MVVSQLIHKKKNTSKTEITTTYDVLFVLRKKLDTFGAAYDHNFLSAISCTQYNTTATTFCTVFNSIPKHDLCVQFNKYFSYYFLKVYVSDFINDLQLLYCVYECSIIDNRYFFSISFFFNQ